MIVRIDSDGNTSLDDPDTFTAFHVHAAGLTSAQVAGVLGSGAAAGPEDGHVWIPIDRLHALGAEHGGADWREGCDGMIAYARTKGWVDESGDRVLAHIESGD